jgi:hypothetical protein
VIFSVSVWVIVSNCSGERNPSVECRRRRLKKTSMYSKTSVPSSAFDGQERRLRSRVEVLLVFEPGDAEVHVRVDQARENVKPLRVDDRLGLVGRRPGR